MNKKELNEKVKILEIENADLEDKIKLMVNEAYMDGEHLKQQPFIPEYLGFTETIIENDDITEARVYTKKKFNISRPIETTNKKWFIMDPSGEVNKVIIEDMRSAITVLRACGMDISMDDYFEYNAKMEQDLIGKIDKEFEEAGIEKKIEKKSEE